MSSVAVFWDRDNTLIRDPGYISDPEQVELLPGAAEALKRLSAGGFENIIVTNQSGIARGLFDEATLERIHDRMVALFADQGAKIDAIYFCPYLPGDEAKVDKYRQDSELRKPKPGMILQASLERKLDLAGSWMIGDGVHDVQAGRAAGCRTILIRRPDAAEPVRKTAEADFVVDSVEEAAETVLKYTRRAGGGNGEGTAGPAKRDTAATKRDESEPAGDVAAILQEILSFMRQVDRRSRADEFALGRLLGAMAQIIALGALTWVIFGWLRDEVRTELLVRLGFASLFQLMALTCFSLSPRK
jgi:D-glycero-D-manno-heptose 1,7-bisphosphate phosphatase